MEAEGAMFPYMGDGGFGDIRDNALIKHWG